MRHFIILAILFLAFQANGQFVNQGAKITIQKGATLTVPSDFRNEADGQLLNEGKLIVRGHLENTDGLLRGGGLYRIRGDFRNLADFQADTSVIVFEGENSNLLTSGYPLYRLRVELDNGRLLYLQGPAAVLKALEFESDHTYVALQDQSLLIGPLAQITGYDANNFILTLGLGKLEKGGFADFLFPVGHQQGSYTPLRLTEQGNLGQIGVRALAEAYTGGLSGAPLAQAVSVSWEVMSDVPQGAVNATVQWNGVDEPPLFDRSQSGIIHYDGTAWENEPPVATQALGSDPYTQSRSDLPASGIYTVSASQLPPEEIPTMGQWAFFLFGLSVFTVMVVGVWNVRGEIARG